MVNCVCCVSLWTVQIFFPLRHQEIIFCWGTVVAWEFLHSFNRLSTYYVQALRLALGAWRSLPSECLQSCMSLQSNVFSDRKKNGITRSYFVTGLVNFKTLPHLNFCIFACNSSEKNYSFSVGPNSSFLNHVYRIHHALSSGYFIDLVNIIISS